MLKIVHKPLTLGFSASASAERRTDLYFRFRAVGTADMPAPFQNFCERYPDYCQDGHIDIQLPILGQKELSQIQNINKGINSKVMLDSTKEGDEIDPWRAFESGSGNSAEIAILKQLTLIAAGIHTSAPNLMWGQTEDRQDRAFLAVDTCNMGQVVLSCRSDKLLTPTTSGYKAQLMQSPMNRQDFFKIHGTEVVATPQRYAGHEERLVIN